MSIASALLFASCCFGQGQQNVAKAVTAGIFELGMNNELIISAINSQGSDVASVSGAKLFDHAAGASYFAGGLAYAIQAPGPDPTNPTWTTQAGTTAAVITASLKSTPSGSGGAIPHRVTGGE